jgi:hypothetical protein
MLLYSGWLEGEYKSIHRALVWSEPLSNRAGVEANARADAE